jgi:hypothetical protein
MKFYDSQLQQDFLNFIVFFSCLLLGIEVEIICIVHSTLAKTSHVNLNCRELGSVYMIMYTVILITQLAVHCLFS